MTLDRQLPPIVVITLPESIERRRATETRLDRLKLSAEFVDGIDAASARADAAVRLPSRAARALSPTELACLLSHLSVWTRIAEGTEPVCVLEDDCAIDEEFVRGVRGAMTPVAAWDITLLGHHSARRPPAAGATPTFRGIRLDARRRLARPAEFAMGAYAYVVTPAGARTLIASAHHMRMPADWITGYSAGAGARLYLVTPPCVVPDPAFTTTISGRDGPMEEARGWAGVRARIRCAGGELLLFGRRLGLWTNSYVKRF